MDKMTNEEAIRIIKIVLAVVADFEIKVNGEKFTKKKCKEAVEIAVKALEQEPCTDCISREAVKNIIRGGVSTDTEADIEYVCGLIDGIPSVAASEKVR